MLKCPACKTTLNPSGTCAMCGWGTGPQLATTPQGPKVDEWQGLTEPPQPDPLRLWEQQIKSEAYYRALEDGRVLMWRSIATKPNDRPYIAGGVVNGAWYMIQVTEMGGTHICLGLHQNGANAFATHWREDTVGTPYVAPASDRLPRMGG